MGKNIVITIGRQNGSGGHEIGKRVAEELGIDFYDKSLIQMAAQKCGIHEDIAKESEETATSSLLYTLSTSAVFWNGMETELPVTDRIYIAQAEIIKRVSGQTSCVIVGRCADDILRKNPNCIRAFIHADMSFRLKRMEDLHHLSEERAMREIKRMDKKRANYYNYFTDHKWGAMDNYTVSINSAELGIDGAVSLLKHLYQEKKALLDL